MKKVIIKKYTDGTIFYREKPETIGEHIQKAYDSFFDGTGFIKILMILLSIYWVYLVVDFIFYF